MLGYAADNQPENREQQLRAGYIFHLAAFVTWPSLAAADPLNVCFIGGADIRGALDAMSNGKPIGSHRVAARAVANVGALDGCQVLYLDSAAHAMNNLVSEMGRSAMLTISDQADFVHHGGIVELFTEDNRLRFNINLDNARNAGLKVSSNLLQLASHVEDHKK